MIKQLNLLLCVVSAIAIVGIAKFTKMQGTVSAESAPHLIESNAKAQQRKNAPQLNLNDGSAISCIHLLAKSQAECEVLEADLLATNVRMVIHSQLVETTDMPLQRLESNGYATVKDGRYLVTHNHFGIPTNLYDDPAVERSIYVTLYAADGRKVLETNFGTIKVVTDETDILMFDFGEIEGVGRLAQFGLNSAEFIINADQQLPNNAIIAQLDWNGSTAHINWTSVRTIEQQDGTDYVSLHSCIMGGASGGGLFWNGKHIANNFARVHACDAENGELYERYSVAAFNSVGILQ